MAALATSFIPPLPPEAIDPDHGLKLRFAGALVRCGDPMKAAMAICEPSQALRVADLWPFDETVIKEMERYIEANPVPKPSRDKTLADIRAMADKPGVKDADKVKYMELYCKVAGFIEKPGTSTTEVKVAVQSVLVIPSQGTDEDWERRSAMSQQRLVLNAASS